ncbi:MAG: hypothetical protein EOO20_14385 [Chryseobacterium sp.]|nr:MAG: hypothetical protein EOO20_14385 [Chryseobacterium sp.]
MAFLVQGKNEFDAYLKLIRLVMEEGYKSSRYLEVLNCLLSIEYSKEEFQSFINYKEKYLQAVGGTAKVAWQRAIRVYTTFEDRMTKPSYHKRMRDYSELLNGEVHKIDQIDTIINELSHKPKYSLLSFTIFRPVDYLLMKRPGYIPCPIAGDFKFRKGKLHLNIFFRSHDVLNFGYADIYFLRKLQLQVLDEAQQVTRHLALKKGEIGSLNFHFSRAFLPLRMEMRKKQYINGEEIRDTIDRLLESLITNSPIIS